jgi:hypothetical protein
VTWTEVASVSLNLGILGWLGLRYRWAPKPKPKPRVKCTGICSTDGYSERYCRNFNVPGCETDQCPAHCRAHCRCGAGEGLP